MVARLLMILFILSFSSTLYSESKKVPHDQLKLETVQLLQSSSRDKTQLLKVSLNLTSRCSFGDMDLIGLDLLESVGRTGLQLTVETLDQDKPEVFYGDRVLEVVDGSRLTSFEVELPKSASSRLLGVFLCSVDLSSEERKGCGQMERREFSKMIARYKVDIRNSIKPDGTLGVGLIERQKPGHQYENVYFFKPFVLDGSQISFSTVPMNEVRYGKFYSEVDSKLKEEKDLDQKKKTLEGWSSTLKSEPLFADSGSLGIVLPYLDNKKCGVTG